jgi:hypothetical protein
MCTMWTKGTLAQVRVFECADSGLTARTTGFFLLCVPFSAKLLLLFIIVTMIIIYAVPARVVEVFVVGSRVVSHVICTGFM